MWKLGAFGGCSSCRRRNGGKGQGMDDLQIVGTVISEISWVFGGMVGVMYSYHLWMYIFWA